MAINLVIADDHEVVRVGLKTLLSGTDIHIIAEASDGNAAFKLANKHRPDLVLLDVRMPDGDGYPDGVLTVGGGPATDLAFVTLLADER